MSSSPLQKIAIIGATGRIGSAITSSLLATGLHKITALTRSSSTSSLPSGVHKLSIDYSSPSALTSALSGQDVLIITLPVSAPPDLHSVIVRAAQDAKVKYVFPNAWGSDILSPSLRDPEKGDMYAGPSYERCMEIERGGASYVAAVCGFWPEWSLALGEAWFGFDIPARKVVFYDDGRTKIDVSTWGRCGDAVAALLALPEKGEKGELCLEDWRNKPFYFNSFETSQREMLDGLHRVLGTKDEDWKIERETTKERYETAFQALKEGKDKYAYARAMYARIFFPTGEGNFGRERGLANEALGLKPESFDEMIARAVEMAEGGYNPLGW